MFSILVLPLIGQSPVAFCLAAAYRCSTWIAALLLASYTALSAQVPRIVRHQDWMTICSFETSSPSCKAATTSQELALGIDRFPDSGEFFIRLEGPRLTQQFGALLFDVSMTTGRLSLAAQAIVDYTLVDGTTVVRGDAIVSKLIDAFKRGGAVQVFQGASTAQAPRFSLRGFSAAFAGMLESGGASGAFSHAALGPELRKAAVEADAAAVRALLALGADPNAPDGGYETPLHWASRGGSAEVVDVLIAAGADVNAANLVDMTPLFLAAGRGNPGLVQRLLRAGASTNVKENLTGKTPLHQAAQDGDVDTVRLLLAAGASTAARDSNGRTPLDLATASGHRDVQLLLRRGP